MKDLFGPKLLSTLLNPIKLLGSSAALALARCLIFLTTALPLSAGLLKSTFSYNHKTKKLETDFDTRVPLV